MFKVINEFEFYSISKATKTKKKNCNVNRIKKAICATGCSLFLLLYFFTSSSSLLVFISTWFLLLLVVVVLCHYCKHTQTHTPDPRIYRNETVFVYGIRCMRKQKMESQLITRHVTHSNGYMYSIQYYTEWLHAASATRSLYSRPNHRRRRCCSQLNGIKPVPATTRVQCRENLSKNFMKMNCEKFMS